MIIAPIRILDVYKRQLPYNVELFCIEHFDFFHQFIQQPGCQLFYSGVLANQTDEHIRCHGAAALLFDFGAELFDFLEMCIRDRSKGEAFNGLE